MNDPAFKFTSPDEGLKGLAWALLAVVLSGVLWVASIPPCAFAEGAYVAFVPLLLWLMTRPGLRITLVAGFVLGWLAWFAMLIWLRHVTWLGTIGLSAILGLLFVLWVLLARWLLPVVAQRSFGWRLLAFSGLAAGWVLIEWSRNWLLYDFPWAPLALSQWQRPVVLQLAAWTGAYGVSFLLIFFNACVAQTLWQRATAKERKFWSGWFSPDLYLALTALAGCVYLFFNSLPGRDSGRPLFRAAVVQPYIPPELKWDTDRELENLEILERQTQLVGLLESDVILWPEAATPWAVRGYAPMQERVEALAAALGRPILMGALARDAETDVRHNGAALVAPDEGLSDTFYVKRELVPFGEYVPWPFHGIIEKFVPLEGSFVPGTDPNLLPLEIDDRLFEVGALVCYEDVFPSLVRESVRAGAEVLFVTTNNAWYGEEGGAYQHAAHSVLRAVENRRPVMRCGNGGWSGWIDAYGSVRKVARDERGSIYFRGGDSFEVVQYADWIRRQSFYTRHGDW
ncbi:MAG: apolipoprotein N-acyltransferase, partial [Verrucomicrobiota bacterium]